MAENCSPFDVVDHAEETFSQNDTVTQGESIEIMQNTSAYRKPPPKERKETCKSCKAGKFANFIFT